MLILANMPMWLPWLLMSVGGAVVIAVVVVATLRGRGDVAPRLALWKRAQPVPKQISPSSAPVQAGLHRQPGTTAHDRDSTPNAPPAFADLEALARSVLQELDAKAERLEALTAAADERIATLQRMMSMPAASGTPHVHDRAPRTHDARRGAAPVVPSFHSAEPPREETFSSRVLALASEGHTPVQIAQRLGQGVGTVELVLALHR